jgi:ADP-heptose:LPS heptosyltransferase
LILKNDCKHFPGDRPCNYHKERGIKCDTCPFYDKRGARRILVIKLDAVGDVLRTTSILTPLHEKYPQTEITWVTKSDAIPIFNNNPLVNKVLLYEQPYTLAFIQNQKFDLVINLDSSPQSSTMATVANSNQKLGFGIHESGYVYPFNPEAEEWFQMGAFDDLKQANTKTYQSIMLEILGLSEYKDNPIILKLNKEELALANEFAKSRGLAKDKITIGLNTGAGGRWKMKKWTQKGYEELIKKLLLDDNIQILLYGGGLERERNAELTHISDRVIDTGSDNTLRQFFTLLSLSDIVVTGDTLALHAAIGLEKRIVVLFGPTSYNEIELYDKGEKIFPKMECLGCYLPDCDVPRKCMERITVDEVYQAILRQIENCLNH